MDATGVLVAGGAWLILSGLCCWAAYSYPKGQKGHTLPAHLRIWALSLVLGPLAAAILMLWSLGIAALSLVSYVIDELPLRRRSRSRG